MSTRSKTNRPVRSVKRKMAAPQSGKSKPMAKPKRPVKAVIASRSGKTNSTPAVVKKPTTLVVSVAENDSRDEVEDTSYQVEEIIKMEKSGSKYDFLVSWIGYDDVTWEPSSNIPTSLANAFKMSLNLHVQQCKHGEVKECLDMVDEARSDVEEKWLFKVSWAGCTHITWEPESKLPQSLVSRFRSSIEVDTTDEVDSLGKRRQSDSDVNDVRLDKKVKSVTPSTKTAIIRSTLTSTSTSRKRRQCEFSFSDSDVDENCFEKRVKTVTPSTKRPKANAKTGIPATPKTTIPVVQYNAEVCPVCRGSSDLGSKCLGCKRSMHHFCASDVCKSLELKDSNGEDILEFPNDISYCSGACYFGPQERTTFRKQLRRLSESPSESDYICSDEDLDDDDFVIALPLLDDDNPNTHCRPVPKAKLNSFARKSLKSNTPVENNRPVLPTPTIARTSLNNNGPIVPTLIGNESNPNASGSTRDSLVNQMVAFSAAHEDWMETEVPSAKTKSGKLKKSRPGLYELAKGSFMFGRIHKAKNIGQKHSDKKYEVRWTQTGFNKPKYVHRLTIAQVKRGITNYEAVSGERLTRATFEQICKVPASEVMDVNIDLDDYVIADTSANDMIMDQEYPENLQVIEELKTLDFQPNRSLKAPQDLYTHDDGSTETKVKKEMYHLFETASSSFFAYLPLPFWREVVVQTNLYAKDDKGAAVTLEELIKFLGIMFYMTVVSKGEYSNYWGEQIEGQILGLGLPGLETVMSRRRFIYIRKNLCFRANVPKEDLKRDSAARIRPLISALKSTCPLYVDLGRNVAVDESSIACRSKYGRHLIVYNASKPTGKYHFKIYACCCATSWLMVNFRLHCNSQLEERQSGVMTPDAVQQLKDDTAFSSTVREIVLEVISPLRGTKRIVNTDNFYTSVTLLRSLRNFGMYGRGTVRESSAHFPKAHMLSKKSSEARGSSLQGVCSTDRIIAASWRDGTTVNVISNADRSSMGEVTRLVGQTTHKFAAPACIAEYNKYMQGVDRLDQLRAKYSIADGHSMQKWHLKLALAFIDIARVNAYITKRMRDNHRYSRNPHQDFMAELASQMISGSWKDNVDDGGLFIADLARSSSAAQEPASSTPAPTPTSDILCEFVLSSSIFPDATRGKRGCRVCLWEGRTRTMKTNYCSNHNVCLCSETYPINPEYADIVCPNEDWNCWQKYHDFYLKQGLFNAKGHIVRKSQLNIARRALIEALNLPEHASVDVDERHASVDVDEREEGMDVVEQEEGMDPNRLSSGSFMSLLLTPHPPTLTATNSIEKEAPSTPALSSGEPFTPGLAPSTPALSNGQPVTPGLATPASSTPSIASPPTLVVTPFDGALANAAIELEDGSTAYQAPVTPANSTPAPSHDRPFTPGMSNDFVDMSDCERSSISTDFTS